MECNCYICYGLTDTDFTCDRCDNTYCEDCSYIYGIHYQFEGSRCYKCADQNRVKKLTIIELRNKKIDYICSK